MSSMRNAVQRRNHKERAQPLERQKWGLLEKHKDYSKRAKDHNRKKQAIKALQAKAENRNEDEFYFGMINAETKNGVKVAKRTAGQGGGTNLTREEIELMKTQDVGYLRTVLQQTKKEREKLEEETTVAEKWAGKNGMENKRTVFDEDGEAVRERRQKKIAEALSDKEEESVDEDALTPEEKTALQEKRDRREQLARKRRKVEALKKREKQLATALNEVEHQRARMQGTTGGVNKNGVKFKVRRKR